MKFYIYSIMMFMSSMLMFMFGMKFFFMDEMIIMEWMIYNLNSMKLFFLFYIDYKSLMFIFLVMLISSLIINYSFSYMYMNNEKLMMRFLYLLMFFILAMCLMIISPSILSILLGWDMLGLISYCLVIYYNNMKAYNAGMLTIILNRIGDASLLMLICFMSMYGSWNLFLYSMNNYLMMMMMIMMMTKSAQLPFSSWLPEAMMAPTPISSLVHSSTLVTAGVYLLIRYIDLFNNLYMNNFILILSSFTMLISGIIANFEGDLKKIVAFSTLSQLGFMLSIVALNLKDLGFLHLLIHALFKSLMFLCVGSLIHYFNNSQDLNNYSGMLYMYPFKSMIMLFSLFSLCGMPFLVGFYSKDLMIEFFMFNKINMICLINLFLGTLMTISYSFQIMFVFLIKCMKLNMMYMKEDFCMNISIFILMLMSIFLSKNFFNMNFVFMNFDLLIIYKMFIFKMMFLGFMISYNLFMLKKNIYFKYIYYFKNMMFLNFFKYFYIDNLLFMIKYELYIEKGILEILMSKFMYFNVNMINYKFKMLSFYTMMMIYFLIIMFIYKI